jgi:HD-GYP domain-containing protein (c-di-GMP phosphodiesterase class II)
VVRRARLSRGALRRGDLAEVRAGAGTQFDPTVARIFVQLVERGALEVKAAP